MSYVGDHEYSELDDDRDREEVIGVRFDDIPDCVKTTNDVLVLQERLCILLRPYRPLADTTIAYLLNELKIKRINENTYHTFTFYNSQIYVKIIDGYVSVGSYKPPIDTLDLRWSSRTIHYGMMSFMCILLKKLYLAKESTSEVDEYITYYAQVAQRCKNICKFAQDGIIARPMSNTFEADNGNSLSLGEAGNSVQGQRSSYKQSQANSFSLFRNDTMSSNSASASSSAAQMFSIKIRHVGCDHGNVKNLSRYICEETFMQRKTKEVDHMRKQCNFQKLNKLPCLFKVKSLYDSDNDAVGKGEREMLYKMPEKFKSKTLNAFRVDYSNTSQAFVNNKLLISKIITKGRRRILEKHQYQYNHLLSPSKNKSRESRETTVNDQQQQQQQQQHKQQQYYDKNDIREDTAYFTYDMKDFAVSTMDKSRKYPWYEYMYSTYLKKFKGGRCVIATFCLRNLYIDKQAHFTLNGNIIDVLLEPYMLASSEPQNIGCPDICISSYEDRSDYNQEQGLINAECNENDDEVRTQFDDGEWDCVGKQAVNQSKQLKLIEEEAEDIVYDSDEQDMYQPRRRKKLNNQNCLQDESISPEVTYKHSTEAITNKLYKRVKN